MYRGSATYAAGTITWRGVVYSGKLRDLAGTGHGPQGVFSVGKTDIFHENVQVGDRAKEGCQVMDRLGVRAHGTAMQLNTQVAIVTTAVRGRRMHQRGPFLGLDKMRRVERRRQVIILGATGAYLGMEIERREDSQVPRIIGRKLRHGNVRKPPGLTIIRIR